MKIVSILTNWFQIFFATFQGNYFLGQSVPYYDIFTTAQKAAYEMFKIIDHSPIINAAKHNGIVPENILGNVEFSNMYFEYPSRPDIKARINNFKINRTFTASYLLGIAGTKFKNSSWGNNCFGRKFGLWKINMHAINSKILRSNIGKCKCTTLNLELVYIGWFRLH